MRRSKKEADSLVAGNCAARVTMVTPTNTDPGAAPTSAEAAILAAAGGVSDSNKKEIEATKRQSGQRW